MKLNIRGLFRNLRTKYRFSIRNQHTDTEAWYMHISPMRLGASFLALVLILFIVVTTLVAYTPMLDFIPGYPGSKSREILVRNIMRLDSLERELTNMQTYNENIALILAGKNPVTPNAVQGTTTDSLGVNKIVPAIAEDSILRVQMETRGGRYGLNNPESARKTLRSSLDLFPPVKGVLIKKFNATEQNFGVGIGTTINQQVIAVTDGTVISASWVPQSGYVLLIQHPDNMVSVYRNNVSILKKVGDRVSGGEVIGTAGSVEASAAAGKSIFEFELWHNGTPIDPMGYIVL